MLMSKAFFVGNEYAAIRAIARRVFFQSSRSSFVVALHISVIFEIDKRANLLENILSI